MRVFLDSQYKDDAFYKIPDSNYHDLKFTNVNNQTISSIVELSDSSMEHCLIEIPNSNGTQLCFVYKESSISLEDIKILKSIKFIKKISKNIIKIVF